MPSKPPTGVRVQHKISLHTIVVKWNAIDEKDANGRFRGYRIKYTARKVAGIDVIVTDSSSKEIVVDKFTFKLKLNDLTTYSLYDISVSGFTEAGNGPFSQPVSAGKLIKKILIEIFS